MISISDTNRREQPSQSLRIDQELGELLRSLPFRGSKQCQALLQYLVEKSLIEQGAQGSLKERTIGVEVFRREPDYNTADDPIVRARVGEVRKRLAQYYQTHTGAKATVQFDIPPGSYRVNIVVRTESHNAIDTTSVPRDAPAPSVATGAIETRSQTNPTLVAPASSNHWAKASHYRAWVIVATSICAFVVGLWILKSALSRSELQLFWSPILKSGKPTVVYIGTAPVYVPSEAYTEKAFSLVSPEDLKQPLKNWSLPALPGGQALTADDLSADDRSFVAVWDLKAIIKVSLFLSAHHQDFNLRSGTNIPFEDLRGSPVVLTGAGSNYWAIDMTRNLPFFFDRGLRIRERGGRNRVWSSTLWSDDTITDDYAIVFRLLDSKTGAPVTAIAGITTCGTRAAGEFVTDPVQMNKLRDIPREALEYENIEFVLHTKLVDCTPTSIDLVDVRYW